MDYILLVLLIILFLNKQNVIDISEGNQELKESPELYKESVINNISNETIDNISEVITYREDEEIHI